MRRVVLIGGSLAPLISMAGARAEDEPIDPTNKCPECIGTGVTLCTPPFRIGRDNF